RRPAVRARSQRHRQASRDATGELLLPPQRLRSVPEWVGSARWRVAEGQDVELRPTIERSRQSWYDPPRTVHSRDTPLFHQSPSALARGNVAVPAGFFNPRPIALPDRSGGLGNSTALGLPIRRPTGYANGNRKCTCSN